MVTTDIQAQFYGKGYGGNPKQDLVKTAQHLDLNSRYWRVVSWLTPGQTFLDVGCGSGVILYLARELFDELHGVDIIAELLSQIRESSAILGKAVHLHQLNLDIQQLPYPDNFFDAVTCVAVLEFLFNPVGVVKDIVRVAKPGGTVVVQVGNIAYIRNRLRLLFGVKPFTTKFQNAINGGALYHFTLSSLKKILREEGLSVYSSACSGRFYKCRSFYPSLLGGDIILAARKE